MVAGQKFVSTVDRTGAMGFIRMDNNPEDPQGSLPVLNELLACNHSKLIALICVSTPSDGELLSETRLRYQGS